MDMDQFGSPKSEEYAHLSAPLKVLRIVIGVAVIVGIAWGYIYYQNISNQRKILQEKASTIQGSVPKITDAIDAFNQNNFDEALGKTNAILAQDPKNITALFLQALTLAQRGSIEFKEKEYGEQAIVVAQQALEVAATDTERSEAWRIIGYANEIMERFDKAFVAYDTSLKFNPNNALAISQKGHAYGLQGDVKKARELYEQALKIDPSLDHARINFARALVFENDTDGAITEFKKVISTTSNQRFLAESNYAIGSLYTFRREHILAEQFLKSATVADPTFALGWIGLGREQFFQMLRKDIADMQRGDLVNASFGNLTKGLKINPNQTLGYYQFGLELGFLGEKEKAILMLKQALVVVGIDIALSRQEKVDFRKSIEIELKKL